MKRIVFLLVLLVFSSSAYALTIYKWTDKDGGVNFTDDFTKIPPQYRDKVKTEEREDSPGGGSQPAPAFLPQKGEEVRRDGLGLGEGYWRDRARPWNTQLKEATANLENVNQKIVEKSETIRRRHWSPTQYKMNMVDLDRLKEERAKYQAQVDEATEMLKKLTREAEDARADPAWLKPAD